MKSSQGSSRHHPDRKRRKREKRDVEKKGMILLSVRLPISELKHALSIDCEDFTLQYGFPKPEKHHKNFVFRNHLKSGTAGKRPVRNVGEVRQRRGGGGRTPRVQVRSGRDEPGQMGSAASLKTFIGKIKTIEKTETEKKLYKS
jgi:hypothetical protein